MKKNVKMIFVVFFLALIMCGGYVIGHYSTDIYNIMNIGYNQYSICNNLKEGRPIMFLIDQLALLLKIDYNVFVILTVMLALLITSIVVVYFYHMIEKYFNKEKSTYKLIFLGICFTIYFNFMYIECLYFVECVVMSLALLLYLISADYFINKKKIWIAVILAILANFCYNGFQCYYVTIVFILSLFKNKNNYKVIFRDVFVSGLFVITAVVLNLVQIKITCNVFGLVNNRIRNCETIFYNIYSIFISLPWIIKNTAGLLNRYIYFIYLCVIFILGVIYSIIRKRHQELMDIFLIILISIFSCFCIFVFTLSSLGTGRMMYSIGMTIGLLFLYTYRFIYNKKISKMLMFLFLFYFLINVFNYIYIIHLHKQINKIEEQEVKMISDYINEYEQRNGIRVKKITYVPSKAEYNGIQKKRYSTVTSNALNCYWSYDGVVNFYTGRKLKKISTSEKIISKYKKLKNKNENRVVIYEDILMVPIYEY